MKYWQKTAVGFAIGLALNTGVRADDLAATNQPHATIPGRNVFDLNPPVAAGVLPPGEPPPKITPNGIMSIFGQWQVLFKVGPTGQPGRENCYMLSERQSQDGIEVLHIAARTGLITFNNHGVVQKIPLANLPAITAPILAMDEPFTLPAVTLPETYPPEFIRARTPDYLGGGPDAAPDDKSIPNTSLEQRIILIEAQRAYLKSQNDPAADLLPPTALTPPDAFAPKGDQPSPP